MPPTTSNPLEQSANVNADTLRRSTSAHAKDEMEDDIEDDEEVLNSSEPLLSLKWLLIMNKNPSNQKTTHSYTRTRLVTLRRKMATINAKRTTTRQREDFSIFIPESIDKYRTSGKEFQDHGFRTLIDKLRVATFTDSLEKSLNVEGIIYAQQMAKNVIFHLDSLLALP